VTWVWLALLVSFLAVAGSIAFLVIRALEAWRGFRSFSTAMGEATDAVNARVGVLGPKADALGERGDRVSASVARLARSQAQLAVLTAALADVRATVSWFTGVVPRK
jgi:hypothetical protein